MTQPKRVGWRQNFGKLSDMAETPEPGIYPDVPADVYHSWDAASNSRLSKLVPPSTPAHLKAYLDEPPEGTKAMREGRILHTCVLEPDKYESDYRLASRCVATTAKGAQCSKSGSHPLDDGIGSVCTTHLETAAKAGKPYAIDPGVLIVSEADDHMVRSVSDVMHAHPTVGPILSAEDGQTELSVVWDDPETGVRIKARWDFYSASLAGGTIADVKGARDASERGFKKDGFWHGYFRQATLYLWGARELGLPAENFVLIPVEKVPPYALSVFRVTEETIGLLPGPGEAAMNCAANVRALLRLWDKCQRTGAYHGYPTEVQDLDLEEWQWGTLDDQTKKLEELVA